jgi:hypothetical protein
MFKIKLKTKLASMKHAIYKGLLNTGLSFSHIMLQKKIQTLSTKAVLQLFDYVQNGAYKQAQLNPAILCVSSGE